MDQYKRQNDTTMDFVTQNVSIALTTSEIVDTLIKHICTTNIKKLFQT